VQALRDCGYREDWPVVIRAEVPIINKLGLHARAAAKLVRLAGAFGSTVQVEHNGLRVNGKSIMGVMMLAAGKGCRVTLEVDGVDEADAFGALATLIADRFEEAE
jgi:phosphocarrier protein HPr